MLPWGVLMEFEIQFTDVTLLEANGEYDDVVRIMSKPEVINFVETPLVKDWVISSTVTIQHMSGFAVIKADFYHDGKIVVTDYTPSIRDTFNPDIRCLKFWAVQSGWTSIEPTQATIDSMKDFWKNQWDTYVVDSTIFDEQYGPRKDMIFSDDDEIDS